MYLNHMDDPVQCSAIILPVQITEQRPGCHSEKNKNKKTFWIIATKTSWRGNGGGKKKTSIYKKYVLYSFGFKIILPYERTVVTSCMQFTKTLQAQWETTTDCFMVSIYRYAGDHTCVSSCVTVRKGTFLEKLCKSKIRRLAKMHSYLQ